jgi:drug/metabolite transporter (DMT)-like permease
MAGLKGTRVAKEMPGELKGTAAALGAAVLFGLSAPLAKLLLADAQPLLLSGLLYLGAGVGLLLLPMASSGIRSTRRRSETPLRRADAGLLVAIVGAGGVLGPLLLLTGLSRVSGLVGSLVLNLEAPFTVLLAVLVFGEHLGFREAGAVVVIFLGVVLLSSPSEGGASDLVGVAAIAGACLSWALDNNLTQRLSLRDPVAVARTKGLGAGAASLMLALVLGERLPSPAHIGLALLLGFASYGVSLVLAVEAMRLLGAAREAAFFAVAPFAGALAAIPLLGDRLGARELIAMLVLGLGVVVLIREEHGHAHTHAALEHEHGHVHDEHHQHPHSTGDPDGEPHAHTHRHAPITHRHAHSSDLHHRHRH